MLRLNAIFPLKTWEKNAALGVCSFTILLALMFHGSVVAQGSDEDNLSQQNRLNKHYQLALYEYFQGDLFSALTQFEILQQRFPNGLSQLPKSLVGQTIEAELLLGGVSLAHGLENQAVDIFSRLLKQYDKPEMRSMAWMLLGKTYYQAGQYKAATHAFAQIEQYDAKDNLSTDRYDQWLYYQAQLSRVLADAQYQQSQDDLNWQKELSGDSIYRHYLAYNQALALLEQGQTEAAIASLRTLAGTSINALPMWIEAWFSPLNNGLEEQEFFALQDRANLTLGYTLLQQNKAAAAQRAFKNVRVDSLDSQAALLGYGWAAAKDEELQIALSIWQVLTALPDNNEYVMEAYLASAYAYEQAFAPIQAIDVLQQALKRFQQSIEQLSASKEQKSQEAYIIKLANSVGVQGTEHQLSISPELLTKDFRTKLDHLKQSTQIQQQLLDWQKRMGQYHLMLDERQIVRSDRASALLQDRLLEQLPEYQHQAQGLAALIEQAEKAQDGKAFLSEEQRQSLARLQRAKANQEAIVTGRLRLQQKPLSPKYQQRLKRLQGILDWQASENYHHGLQQAKKAQQALHQELQLSQKRQQRLLHLLNTPPEFSKQRQSIEAIEQRIAAHLDSNANIQTSLLRQLRTLVAELVDEQLDSMRNYVLQAQIAIVRINDQAMEKTRGRKPVVDSEQGAVDVN